jgi:hypothetical protein
VPSRKQRRKREKLQRHEYEYVVETEEGEEVIEGPRAAEAKSAANGKRSRPASSTGAGGRSRSRPSSESSSARPSLAR